MYVLPKKLASVLAFLKLHIPGELMLKNEIHMKGRYIEVSRDLVKCRVHIIII